jgi:hypothetical protein
MCLQYASRTWRAPSASLNTTSLVPNASMPWGLPSAKSSANPRQCHPLAKRCMGEPVSISRIASASVMGVPFVDHRH